MCPWSSVFDFCVHRSFFLPIWSVSFSENVFVFDILIWSPTLNLGSLSLLFLPESNYRLFLTSAGFIVIVLWYILLYLFPISSNLSIYTFYDIEVMYLQILVFRVIINLSATIEFHSLCVSMPLFFNQDFMDLL